MRFQWLVYAACIVFTSGCATVSTRSFSHQCAFEDVAYPIGIEAVQSLEIAGAPAHNLQHLMLDSVATRDKGDPSSKKPLQWLVLSGGGQWGAFGAGFLEGWTAASDRPEFDVVTGVSTGALMAPFAFLGSAYDRYIVSSYSINNAKQLVRSRAWTSSLFGNSLYNNAPLRTVLTDSIRQSDAIRKIAAADASGRKLLIGTVDLDSGGFFAIDMTRLATLPMPNAQKEHCFVDYIMASSAVPVAFPPIFIDGHMLVDGNARASVFLGDLTAIAKRYGSHATEIYVVRNGHTQTHAQQTRNKLLPIATRTADIVADQIGTLSTLDLIRQARTAGRTHFTSADDIQCLFQSENEANKLFVPAFMKCLIAKGHQLGSDQKSRWHNFQEGPSIPTFVPASEQPTPSK